MFKKILLATHGTRGARAAEAVAVDLAAKSGASLYCLQVINEDWQWMTGDDWLNTSACRNRFRRHVENELNQEANATFKRVVEQASKMSVQAASVKKVGAPLEVILATAQETGADLIVVGSRQRRQDQGFRSRLPWDKFLVQASVPVLVVPRPL